MHKPMTTVLAIALLLSGCTTLAPRSTEVMPGIPSEWPLAGTPGTEAASAAGSGWREMFPDTRLQQVISQALVQNRDLRVAMANVDRARAQYRIQRADRLPALAVQGQMERSGGDVPTVEQYSVGLGVTAFELDLFGRVRNLSEAALHRYFEAAENRRSAQLALVAEVAHAWLALGADHDLLRISQDTLDSHAHALRLAEARYRLGGISALDLAQTRTLVESARTDVARHESQVKRDLHALELLAGGAVDAALLPDRLDAGASVTPALPAGLPADVLLRRPDIVAAEHRLLAANADIGAARAAFFPSISLTGSFGSASGELSGLFDGGTRAWSFIPMIRIPIFQGGRLFAGLGVAHADREIAVAQYERSIQAGFREVADALAEHASLALQEEAQQALVESALQAERLSQARYDAGLDSFITLLDARRSAYAARQSLLSTRLAREGNGIALYKVLGGGWY